MKRTASSRPPREGDLQDIRRGYAGLVPQVEELAEQVLPVLRQATQDLARLEAQCEELRKAAAPEAPPPVVLPRMLERLEEQGQHVRRMEQTHRGLEALRSALGTRGARLQHGLDEQDTLAREEKRLWLRELLSLRQRAADASASGDQAQGEEAVRLRAERERLGQRVEELERELAARDEALSAKEQTLADLRRMIVLLTGDSFSAPAEPQPLPAPVEVPRVVPRAEPRVTARPPPVHGEASPGKKPEQIFGQHSMELAHSMLESLGDPPRTPSMEIMLGPLDELEEELQKATASEPPPVPAEARLATTPTPAMARAGARALPAPVVSESPRPPARPGPLINSEDMFQDVLVADSLSPSGRK